MARIASKPGPASASCLTCRQRRKKGGSSSSGCQECLKGDYERLGSQDREPRAMVQRETSDPPIPPQLQDIPPTIPAEAARSESLGSIAFGSPEDWQGSTKSDTTYLSGSSVLEVALLYRMNGPIYSAYDDTPPKVSTSPVDSDTSGPRDKNQQAAHSRSQTRQSPYARKLIDGTSRTRPSKNDLSRVIQNVHQSIPPSVDATQIMRESHITLVINEYHIQRVGAWFMPPPAPIRDSVVIRLRESKRMTWTMYLGTKLSRALEQDPSGTTVRGYIGWIDKLERKFTTNVRSNPVLGDTTDRLMAQLELAFLKCATVDNILGYISLQKAVPRFLQLVATDTDLYMEYPDGNLIVSLTRILNAKRHELKQFVLYDTASALLLGVPPLVELGYDGECDPLSYGLEWVHGIPAVFVEAVSRVNSWRAGSKLPGLDNWHELERRVLAWKPQLLVSDEEDFPTANMARFAVQESWRYAVLIYIYMGMCGVSSHDSRVQDSVHRIYQLGETVGSLPVDVHMLIQYVIAGLAARLEKHRVHIHEKLLSFKDTRVWFFRGPQFSQVLYHLWHGVGEGGAPVTWDDYVQSRCAVLPI